ncbi:MAG: hypothetical protein ACE5JR_02545 [Gemmatimonadota bacterium]
MKTCRECDAMIPDHSHRCPHCRERQRRGERVPQLVLVGAALAAAVAVLVENCPGTHL